MSDVVINVETTVNAPVVNIEEVVSNVVVVPEITEHDVSIDVSSTVINNLIEASTEETRIITINVQTGALPYDDTVVKRDIELNALASGKSGTATLDFGSGNRIAEIVVEGVEQALLTSRVMVIVRLEATPEHPIDDLQIDPIIVLAKNLVVGVGFTIYGRMDNAEANGTYKIDWHLTN